MTDFWVEKSKVHSHSVGFFFQEEEASVSRFGNSALVLFEANNGFVKIGAEVRVVWTDD